MIEDAHAAGADEFLLGGDYALAGAWPAETVKRLAQLDAQWIRGNTERWLEEPSDAPDDDLLHRALEYCRAELGSELTEALFQLPERVEVDGACICHASPHSDVLTFMPEPTEGDHELLSHSNAEVIVFGHSHLQFTRAAEGGRLLVNPGSVGFPFDGDRRAAYALWRGPREFELRRVPYDSDGYADQIRDRMSDALGETVGTLVRRIQQAAMVD